METKSAYPPGHFYSPIPCLDDVLQNEETIFHVPETIPGVDLNPEGQWELARRFAGFYREMPFQPEQQENLRYYFENPNFSYFDAISLHCMIRHAKPKRIIEVGSGFSSCVTLDTNDTFFDNRIDCTFIEPYPDLLLSLMKPGDREQVTIIPSKLQDVPTETFTALGPGDILFIDSTHVSKIDSDVNHALFRILPSLAPGVFIHFHDIFYPFEYPKQWIYDGRAWNENYILRAFLQYNSSFNIVFFNNWFARFNRQLLQDQMPLALKNAGGSIWLQKVE
ncbi:MAG: class I SAM-dependent methyltransferase [Desulfuromonadales bacterium]|nr:class I SAM-dependent methyltransferase [Desulfuromonadales bacterium]